MNGIGWEGIKEKMCISICHAMPGVSMELMHRFSRYYSRRIRKGRVGKENRRIWMRGRRSTGRGKGGRGKFEKCIWRIRLLHFSYLQYVILIYPITKQGDQLPLLLPSIINIVRSTHLLFCILHPYISSFLHFFISLFPHIFISPFFYHHTHNTTSLHHFIYSRTLWNEKATSDHIKSDQIRSNQIKLNRS